MRTVGACGRWRSLRFAAYVAGAFNRLSDAHRGSHSLPLPRCFQRRCRSRQLGRRRVWRDAAIMAQKLTTCTFCGVGCGLYLETAGNQVVGVYPSVSHPTNRGKICVRGWHVHEVASSPDRLKTPLLRKNGQLQPATWEEALRFITDRLQAIRAAHGPDAIAFLNSPRCSNEEAYLLQKLARAVIGTNNVDHGTGVYCNNSMNVLLDMLGAAATTNSLAELNRSEMIIVDGVDLARQMPTIAGIVLRARLNGARLAVIDVRRHRLAQSADFLLQLKPGTETLLYGAMAKVIVDRGLMNLPFIKARCRDYDAFLDQVRHFDLLGAAAACGVPAELIETTALAFARRAFGGDPVFDRHRNPRCGIHPGDCEPGAPHRTHWKRRCRHLCAHGTKQPSGRLRRGNAARPVARLPAGRGSRRARRAREPLECKTSSDPGAGDSFSADGPRRRPRSGPLALPL